MRPSPFLVEPQKAGAEPVPGGETGPDSFGPDEVGGLHAEGPKDVLAQVTVEGLPAHILYDLAERGERVVAICPLGARFYLYSEPPSVVLSDGRHGIAHPHPPAERRPKQVPHNYPSASRSTAPPSQPTGATVSFGAGT